MKVLDMVESPTRHDKGNVMLSEDYQREVWPAWDSKSATQVTYASESEIKGTGQRIRTDILGFKK